MATVNASFNCIAIQALVLPRGWRRRDEFLSLVERGMAATPARVPWYPGAEKRYHRLLDGRPDVRRSAAAPPDALPWALVTGVDPQQDDELFRTEAFCAVLAETSVGSEDPIEYLERAVTFANERLPGTLSANVLVHPATLADPTIALAFERALRRLRYGTVAVNTWTGYGFGFGTTPWGGFPGQPLSDVRSGRGFVHNTLMLEGVEKTVIRHPVTHPMKSLYFPTHRTPHELVPRLIRLEARRAWSELPGIVAAALRGYGAQAGRSAALSWRRASRLTRASRSRRRSSSDSTSSGGTAMGRLSGPRATNVRKASQHFRRSPVMGFSDETSTPTSIDVENTAFTWAVSSAMWPIRMGARNVSWSIDTVTTGPRAWRMAAIAPATSVHCMIIPPNAVPRLFASPGMTRCVWSMREREAGLGVAMGPI